MEGIVVTDPIPAVEEPEITSAAMTRPGPANLAASDVSGVTNGSAPSFPWSLTHDHQVKNLKENWERALYWAGVLFNFEQHFEFNPLLARVVSQLRDDPCLDSCEIEIEKLILGHFAPGPRMTSLDLAILMGDLKMIQEILERGSIPNNVICGHDSSSNKGIYYTPLHLAVVGGDSNIVAVLLQKGANINAQNLRRVTPLDLAFEMGNVTILQQLLVEDRASCPWSLTHKQQVKNLKENWERALYWAGVLFNFEQHFEFNPLLARVVSQLRDDPCLDSCEIEIEKLILGYLAPGPKMTSLDLAILMGDLKMVQEILERDSIPDNVICGHDSSSNKGIYYTPLHLAVVGGDSDIVAVLLQKGANINALNLRCLTPLDLACEMENITVLQQLLEGDKASCPWSLTHGQQVKNLKENWKKALDWTGAQIKLQDNFQINSWFARVVAKLRVDPCLDSNKLKIEQSLLGQFLLGATMNSLDLAILMGDLKMVQKILESSSIPDNVIHGPIQDLSRNRKFLQLTPIFDTHTKTGILYTPLHLAVEGGDSLIVDELLKNGADVNAPNWKGQTPIDLACKNGNVTMLQQLLTKDNEGKDLLHVAARCGDVGFIESLPFLNVNAVNYKKETPLHLAIEGGNSHIVDVLLENGADVNVPNWKDQTPLDLACKNGNVTILEQLLLNLAKDSEEMKGPFHIAIQLENINFIKGLSSLNVNAVDYMKKTALHLAVEGGNRHIIDALLQKGADVNARNWNDQTPLDLACKNGNVTMLQQLLAKDNEGKDLLHVATRCGDFGFIEILSFENVNVVNHKKETPLHLAIEGGDRHIVDVLLKNGADVNAPNWKDQTPMDLACKTGNITILQQLLTKDNEGKDPLHVAVRCEDVGLIERLPSPNVNAVNHKKETPLHLAVEGGNSHVVDALLKNGADVNAQNWNDQTPLDLACKNGNVAMLQQLLAKDKEGKDPLHVVVRLGDVDFMKKLPSPNVNAQDHKKKTPLHYLAMQQFDTSHVANIVQFLNQNKALDIRALDDFRLSAFYVAVLFCNTGLVIALLDSYRNEIQLNEACDDDLGPPIQIAIEKGDKSRDIQRVLMECDRVKGYIENLYRDRQVYVDATNAILVGAALIASVTFASWLQPPLSYTSYFGEGYSNSNTSPSTSDLNYVDVEHNIGLRAFWIFNALSFYFAIGTVVCGARSVLPRNHSFIGRTVAKLHFHLIVTSFLLACSVLFVIVAFAIAGTIVLTPLVKYQWCMIVPTIIGGMVCIISLCYLVRSLVKNYFNTCDYSEKLNKKESDYLGNKGYTLGR